MLSRCDDGRGCGGMKDAAEEKEHSYECEQECEADLYEAKGMWARGALHVQQYVPEPIRSHCMQEVGFHDEPYVVRRSHLNAKNFL